MDKARELEAKLERVLKFLSENNLDGVVLNRTANFAWLGCGADNVVNAAEETGVGTLVATPRGITLVSKNIETQRLITEELAGLDLVHSVSYPWYEPRQREAEIGKLTADGIFAADDGSCDLPPLPESWNRLRYTMTESEIRRYRKLGQDSSAAMETAARAVERGMTEHQIASLVAKEYRSRGLIPVVLLVAVDDRIREWRHPLPKDLALENYAMLVACGRRRGLVTAMTRFVHFGKMAEDLRQRHEAVCEVDARIINATKPGLTAADVFEIAQEAYDEVGFPDEWQLHHQGGAIGYQPREYIADPGCQEEVLTNQAFAWNPSICGTKNEDTVLVTGEGPELLTSASESWPTIEVEVEGQTLSRPDMLIR